MVIKPFQSAVMIAAEADGLAISEPVPSETVMAEESRHFLKVISVCMDVPPRSTYALL